jgi:tRNA:m4X modification enzyme
VGDVAAVQYVLIDRKNCRRKFDSYHRHESSKFRRLLIDIEHLSLAEVDGIWDNCENCVGITKHLCGSATDLALQCLVKTLPASDVCSSPKKPRSETTSSSDVSVLKGIVFALCCHHKCNWSQYVARDVWHQLGLNERDFHLMTLMSSWATCGVRVGGTTGEPQAKGAQWPASAVEREEIGYFCKKLIDYGRREYLQKYGFKSQLIHYVEKSTTLENTALVASRP